MVAANSSGWTSMDASFGAALFAVIVIVFGLGVQVLVPVLTVGCGVAPARAASATALDGIEPAHERMLDAAALCGVAADDGQVAFVHRSRFELSTECGGRVAIKREQQHTGGAAVEAMGRIDALADLVAQQLDGKAFVLCRDQAAMHKQAGRLCDRNQPRIAIKDVEHGGRPGG